MTKIELFRSHLRMSLKTQKMLKTSCRAMADDDYSTGYIKALEDTLRSLNITCPEELDEEDYDIYRSQGSEFFENPFDAQ